MSYDDFYEWLANVAGVAGFILSLILAVSQLLTNRLKIKASGCVLIETKHVRDSVFLCVCLHNHTNLPFSLIDLHINAGHGYRNVPVEQTIRTYYSKGDPGKRAPTGPVVLSPAFPVRFDSYAAEVLLLEVLRQNINTKFLLPDGLDNRGERLHTQFHPFHRLYRRLFPLRLKLRTSRGPISIPVHIESVQGWNWLEKYAVRKAGHEGKILFPM